MLFSGSSLQESTTSPKTRDFSQNMNGQPDEQLNGNGPWPRTNVAKRYYRGTQRHQPTVLHASAEAVEAVEAPPLSEAALSQNKTCSYLAKTCSYLAKTCS